MTRPVSQVEDVAAVAVTPHHLATEAALDRMRAGGNAIDGAVAANAMLGMVLPTTCGIGGDLFALIHTPEMDRPEVLNASGRGGSGLDPGALRAAGHARPPLRSASSVTVPGCVDGWEALLERHGRGTLAEALAPAIAVGREGFETSIEFADSLGRIHDMIGSEESAASLYPGGVPPHAGQLLRRNDLADTLESVATDGRDAFYAGRVAEAIVTATANTITRDDLVANRPDWVEPIGLDLFGETAWTVPPNSQGYLTLATLWLFEQLGWSTDPSDPAFHHGILEAYRAMAWERDDLVSDPRTAPVDPATLLDPERLSRRLASLDGEAVALWDASDPIPGGTAYFCVIDSDGMAVSFIQSNFTGIGSGIGAGPTGVFLHNRGAGFTTAAGHPNEALPGKRPLHTLAPTLWTNNGEFSMLLGTRGGHQQPQYLAQMAALILAAGLDPATAQASPRWHIDQPGGGASLVSVESRMQEGIVAGLTARGHIVDIGTAFPPGWGPVSVIRSAGSRRTAAADPRVSSATASGY